MDLHHIIECGGHVAIYCINCSVKDTKALGAYLGQLKRRSYVGTHLKRANLPASYQNPTPLNGKENGFSGGNYGRGGLKKRNITK